MEVYRPKDAAFWIDTNKDSLPLPFLKQDKRFDMVVVGGGISGLCTADYLSRQGVKVAIVEQSLCGSGATGKSSGIVTPEAELETRKWVDRYGRDLAIAIWGFGTSGVDIIRNIIIQNGLECGHQEQNSLYLATSPNAIQQVEQEFHSRSRLGYPGVLYDQAGLEDVIGSEKFFGGMEYSGTFAFDPYAFCRGYVQVLQDQGVEIFEGTQVTDFGRNFIKTSDHHRIRASQVVLCVDKATPNFGVLKNAIYHAQTYVMVSESLDERLLHKTFPNGLKVCWDTDLPYHYFRATNSGRFLIGGCDIWKTYATHEIHNPPDIHRKLLDYIGHHFPWLSGIGLDEYFYPGMLATTKHLTPIAGLVNAGLKNQVYVIGATTGLPWGAALGERIAQRAVIGENYQPDALDQVFSPDRSFPGIDQAQRVFGGEVFKPYLFAAANAMTVLGR